jgi:hypothetical protein
LLTRWRGRAKTKEEENPHPSEEELLNRVIQAKCIMALAGDNPVHFKTQDEDLVMTPKIARKLIRLAGSRSRKEG